LNLVSVESLVVPGVLSTMTLFSEIRELTSNDFPTLGFPTIASLIPSVSDSPVCPIFLIIVSPSVLSGSNSRMLFYTDKVSLIMVI